MRKSLIIVYSFLLLSGNILAQVRVPDPQKNDFTGTHAFLSSDWMEGREAGSKGCFMAADYIYSQMVQAGLKPGTGLTKTSTYFQDFEIIRSKTERYRFNLISNISCTKESTGFIPGIDFNVECGPSDIEIEAPLMFAGYGITAPQAGYDDYRKINAENHIVIVMDGFPGKGDSLSAGWKKFGKVELEGYYDFDTKKRNALKNGAVAIILVSPEGTIMPQKGNQINKVLLESSVHFKEKDDPEYEDYNYNIPGDSVQLPCLRFGQEAAALLLSGSNIDLKKTAKRISSGLVPESGEVKGKLAGLSIEMKAEPLSVRNVIGYIQGKDTSQSVVIGAHYDHLGIRNSIIYNGSDDNASGVAGMLALAANYGKSAIKPECNLIFAAWTAEEKGMLGSTWFVRNFNFERQKILLNVNFDMISRSDPTDKDARIISIGFLKGTDKFKELAKSQNSSLKKPFDLDLWETSGHGGSDYVPFAMKKIPVMSFFSGYHNDYHSSRDIFAKSDPDKMEAILILANKMILNFLSSYKF
jgi:hypothetical protein